MLKRNFCLFYAIYISPLLILTSKNVIFSEKHYNKKIFLICDSYSAISILNKNFEVSLGHHETKLL